MPTMQNSTVKKSLVRGDMCNSVHNAYMQIIPDDGMEVVAKKGVIEKLVGITSPAATT